MIIKLFFVLSLVGCINDDQPMGPMNPADCGPMPAAPYWEYTEQGGAPVQAMIPLQMWLQDLSWRKDVRAWAECVSPGSSANSGF